MCEEGEVPNVVTRWSVKPEHCRYAYVDGMDGDQIAYVTQASESAVVIMSNGEEVYAEVLLENHTLTHDRLYLALKEDAVAALRRNGCLGRDGLHIVVTFELKHSYFNSLHRSLESVSDGVVARLVPQQSDFHYQESLDSIPPFPYQCLELDGGQTEVLKAALSHVPGPPFLITGAFGTGKTRLLAAATYQFFYEGALKRQPTRVLICTQQNISADTFIENYFGLMKTDRRNPWRVHVVRVTPRENMQPRNSIFGEVYKTPMQCRQSRELNREQYVLVVTTFLTTLKLNRRNYFTHILLDEAAQAREPETIAPLIGLAGVGTKILLAGDRCQVFGSHFSGRFRVNYRIHLELA